MIIVIASGVILMSAFVLWIRGYVNSRFDSIDERLHRLEDPGSEMRWTGPKGQA